MKNYIFITLINIILVVLQISFFYRLFGRFLNPNLVAAFAFSLFFLGMYDRVLASQAQTQGALGTQARRALGTQARRAYFSALVGGIFLDLMGFGTVALSSVILITCLLFAFYIKKYIFKGWATQILSLFITSVAYSVLEGFPNIYFDIKTIFSGLITVAIGLIFYGLLKNLEVEGRNSS